MKINRILKAGSALALALSLVLATAGCSNSSGDGSPAPASAPSNPNEYEFDFTTLSALTEAALGTAGGITVDYLGADGSLDGANGYKLVAGSIYQTALDIAIPATNLTGKKFVIDWKTEGWTYGNDNQHISIKLISEKGGAPDYTPTKKSQGNFALKSAGASSGVETIQVSSFSLNQYDGVQVAADVSKIIGIQVACQDGTGTLYIKSIKILNN